VSHANAILSKVFLAWATFSRMCSTLAIHVNDWILVVLCDVVGDPPSAALRADQQHRAMDSLTPGLV